MKKLILLLAILAIGCSKEETKDYNCGCTDEFFILKDDSKVKLPIRICDLFPVEEVTSGAEIRIYSTVQFGTDINQISKEQGCQD